MKLYYLGPFGNLTGYGDAARGYARGLRDLGVDLRLALTEPGEVPEDLLPLVGYMQEGSSTLVHAIPAAFSSRFRPEGASSYAMTTWETFSLPDEYADCLNDYDDVIVPSQVCYMQMPQVRPAIVPHGFDPKDWPVDWFSSERPYTFLWIGDWSERKNPIGVLKAYWSAFSKKDDVKLVMKSTTLDPQAIEILALSTNRFDDLPTVEFVDGYMPHGALLELYARADAFITLSRGDAWGFPIFHAAALGLPIIAVAEVGHGQFLGDSETEYSNRFIVGQQLTPVLSQTTRLAPDGSLKIREPHGVDIRQFWIEPDLHEAISAMQDFARTRKARDLSQRARFEEQYSWTAVSKRLLEAMEGK